MTVSIVSGIPIFAGPANIVTSIVAPNQGAGFLVTIGDVTGLQAALDSKLDDTLGTLGLANVITTGAELNFLSGATSNIQTQLDGKVDILGDTMTGDLIMSSAVIQLDVALSSAAFPSLVFFGDLDTGLWWPAGDTIGFAVGGLDAFHILPSGLLQSQVSTYETLVVADDDIPNKKYVDDAIALAIGGPFLPLAGGTMTGTLDLDAQLLLLDADGDSSIQSAIDDTLDILLGGIQHLQLDPTCLDLVVPKPIKNVSNPTNPQDAATMDYVDTEIVALGLGGATGPFLRLSGADTMLGQLDMGGFDIVNQLDPTNPQDGATKNYVDTEITALGLTGTGPYLPLSGGTMTGAINMGLSQINNLADPTSPQDAVTRAFADTTYISTTGPTGPLGGNLDAGGFRIVNLGNPVGAQDAATKDYVDTNFLDLLGTSAMQGGIDMGGFGISNLLAATANDEAVNLGQGNSLWLRLDGTSAMTGGLDMGGFGITNLLAPTANDEAVNLGYADATYLDLLGTSSMQAILNMGSFRIVSLANPTAAQDAATKDYVDTEITALNLGSTFVNVSGDTMTGDLTMGPGAQHLADDGLLATPAYAFDNANDSGMLWDGTNLRFSVDAGAAMTIAPSTGTNDVDVHGRVVTGVANPVADDDAVNLGTLNAFSAVKLLDSTTGINLLATGTTALYTVPVGKMHIITQIIVVPTAYTPGASPTNPEVSVGDTGPFNQIVADNTELDWGGTAGASDQAVYLQPRDGAPTPNAGTTIRFQVDTAGGGTFSALTATVYVLGIEL